MLQKSYFKCSFQEPASNAHLGVCSLVACLSARPLCASCKTLGIYSQGTHRHQYLIKSLHNQLKPQGPSSQLPFPLQYSCMTKPVLWLKSEVYLHFLFKIFASQNTKSTVFPSYTCSHLTMEAGEHKIPSKNFKDSRLTIYYTN